MANQARATNQRRSQRRSSTHFLRGFAAPGKHLRASRNSMDASSMSQALQESMDDHDFVEEETILGSYIAHSPVSRESPIAPRLRSGIATAMFLDDSIDKLNLNQGQAADLSVNCLSMKYPKCSVTDDEAPACDLASAARFQEIFIDLASLHSTTMSCQYRHLLDERFATFLGDAEKEFKGCLSNILGDETILSAEVRDTPAFQRLYEFFRNEMGLHNVSQEQMKEIYKVRDLRGKVARKSTHMKQKSAAEKTLLDIAIDTVKKDGTLLRSFAFSKKEEDGKPAKEEMERLLACLNLMNSNCQAEQVLAALENPDFSKEAELFNSLFKVPGHVFVTNTSVCDISCDAFLCPVGGNKGLNTKVPAGTIFPQWLKKIRMRHPNMLQTLLMGDSGKDPVDGPLPLKSYEDDGYDRVDTLANWKFTAPPLGQAHVPFLVAGEVSIERSRLDHSVRGGIEAEELPSAEEHVSALLETVCQFVKVASAELRENNVKPFARRERYLLALPVVGTGGGHAADITGQIVERILRCLCHLVSEEPDIDCVLVCADEATFAHAQGVRSRMCPAIHEGSAKKARTSQAFKANDSEEGTLALPCFNLMTPQMRDHAFQLAELAKDSRLSFFIGAGVSMGAGAPSWFGLLFAVEDCFTKSGKMEERKLGDECGWNPLVMADKLVVVCDEKPDRMDQKKSLKHRICELISNGAHHPSLLMSLIASFPTKSLITQNYDQLIETSFELRNIAERIRAKDQDSLSVIPHTPKKETERWLLKMHGCVSAPRDIVISSRDYEEYEAGRMKALGGLVQANLMTSHLLFIGFSMTDPNFLRIIEEVRYALSPEE